MIYSFDDISGLMYCLNPGRPGTVTNGAGDTVTSIDSVVSSGGDDPFDIIVPWTELEPDASNGVYYNPGTYKLGEWPALFCDSSHPTNTTFWDANYADTVGGYAGPLSVVTVTACTNESLARTIYNSYNTNSNVDHMRLYYQTNDKIIHEITNGTQSTDTFAVTDVPNVIIQAWDVETSVDQPARLFLDKVQINDDYMRSSNHSLKYFVVWPSYSGLISLFAVYKKFLSQDEINDITDLCNHWLTYGEAPTPEVPSYPTFGRFGPVKTNNHSDSTYTWQLQAPGDTDNWQNVPVAGYDIISEPQGDDQYLKVNSGEADQDGTLVRCKATSPSNPTGIYTNINTLNVVVP